jgi:hypothetical protein
MGPELTITGSNLRLFEPDKFSQFDQQPQAAKTPNEWFAQRYPTAYENHGSPFLELFQPDQFTVQILPVTLNHDFFAAVLGGSKELGHHVIYFEPEMMWYFKDSDGIFKSTTAEKLMTVYRALMMKAAQDLPANVNKLNLVHEWRGDRTAKTIIQRAKSILAADHTFFSPTSPNQRIRGPELFERLAKVYVEEVLERVPGETLLLTDAFDHFCEYLRRKNMPVVKRQMFKALIPPAIREQYELGIRNDLHDPSGGGWHSGWKGIRVMDMEQAGLPK